MPTTTTEIDAHDNLSRSLILYIVKGFRGAAVLDLWTCAVCGRQVSKQVQHKHLRERREGGWNHTRCGQNIAANVDAVDVLAALEQRRGEMSLR